MSIGFAWRRVATADIAGLSAKELSALVPHGPADEYVRAEYDGAVVGALLGLGDGDSAGAEAFVGLPADWNDDYLVGTLPANAVRAIATAMGAADWRLWLTEHFDGLVAGAEPAGYEDAMVGAQPDGPWAEHLLRCADQLTRLFGAAAAAGESVVFSMSA